MGQISISISGSFVGGRPGSRTKTFSAMNYGHAHAVNEAMEFLQEEMRKAINLDHALHEHKEKPTQGFQKDSLT